MAKIFIEIQPQDTDTVSWKQDKKDVEVHIARLKDDQWVRALKSVNGRYFTIREADEGKPSKRK